jgi:hypothetical protein
LGDHVLHLENVSSQSLTTEPLSAVCPAALPNDAQTEAWRTQQRCARRTRYSWEFRGRRD